MMIRLTIDGRSVQVPEGSTVLEAARWLGIRIPTLCHVPGLEASASCFVCAVQVEGRRTLSPSCAMPVSEGMKVVTASPAVQAARRTALELLLSDHAGDCVAPCAAACPAGLDIPRFVGLLAAQDTGAAREAIADHLALPGSLGRICPRLCEQNCRRCSHDQGLAIGALHRYAADHASWRAARATPSGKRVAIIGAGPAGLSAAWFLLRRGHACTIFDAHPLAGGMLRYGIPAHRLPKDALDGEIDAVRDLGAEFRLGQRWGTDFQLADLRAGFDAVFVAIGAQHAQDLRCEGEEMALSAVEFLECLAAGNPPDLGSEVIVLGGGNTAMDCARAAARLGSASVRVLYRRTRAEMPALLSEAEEAEREGVIFDFLAAPVRLDRDGHQRFLLTCQRMALGEPDSSGRRRPVPVEGSDFVASCTTVIAAIGQTVDRTVAEHQGLQVSAWGIHADPRTLATNLPGVFAGGDAVLGADLAVRAVAMGRRAAFSIDQFLQGGEVTGEPHPAGVNFQPIDDAERAALFREIEKSARVRMPELPPERRLGSFDEVELGLTAEDVVREARRCLTCGCAKADCCGVRALATEYGADPYRFQGARRRFSRDDSHSEIVYEPGKCIVCGACVRIAEIAEESVGLSILGRGFEVAVGAPFGRDIAASLTTSARACAQACPTAALSIRGSHRCALDHAATG